MPRDGSGILSAPAGTTATAGTPIESAKYNAFVNDWVADGNTARPIVAGGTGATTAGAALAALGGQPLDAGLTSIAGLTTAADRMIYTTAADTYAVATLTAAGRALLDDADAAAQLVTLGAQASDATLTSLSGLSLVAGDLLYATGADTLVRLPKGTAGQALVMNAGATAPEWGGASAPTTAQVLSATAGLSIGAVGSYAYLQRTASNTAISENATIAGSSLQYAGINNSVTSGAANGGGNTGSNPSGTWRALGFCGAQSGLFASTLFVRIS